VTQRLLALLAAAVLATACAPGERVHVDVAASATLDGTEYYAIAAERTNLASASLVPDGEVSATNLRVEDNRAYAIDGIPINRAFAMRLANGESTVLLAEDLLGKPIGSFLPGLCAYLLEPRRNECSATSPTGSGSTHRRNSAPAQARSAPDSRAVGPVS
jgi:hypothetical protein